MHKPRNIFTKKSLKE